MNARWRPITEATGYLRELLALFVLTLAIVLRGRVNIREAIRQAYLLGNRSLLFVTGTMGFIGMIMVLQGCFQAQRLVGDFTMVGPGFLQLLVREFAPAISSMMIATRVGAGIAAELGSMAVTEQLDALRICGAEPIEELVAPRFVACVLMVPALIILSACSAELAGLATARLSFGVPYGVFWNTMLVNFGDVAVGLVKAGTFGCVLPVISSRAGIRARGGSEGVGSATTRAVIDTSVAIIFLDFAINVLLYPLYRR